ncbi:hypothetical protein Z969_07910 [Clostridium novyi A str. 4570]|uniref:Uncharacterized protein n=1 Tax=Clostridium novyi A str. 4570 TaxID=1444290 RepID=A0AA89CRA4_CLONO|nr:hypothetical protein [Clostridium novyi]KGN01655.1 hypothetical protein Z969_07910 [Clostridium novyi A str. 4570]
MTEQNTITLGIKQLKRDSLTLDIRKFYIDEKDTVIINLDKEQNENRITKEIKRLISKEEIQLTGENINRIEELIRKLPIEETRIELAYKKDILLKSIEAQKLIDELRKDINAGDNIKKIEDIFKLMNKFKKVSKIKRNFRVEEIENALISIHKERFEILIETENYSLKSLDDNICKYEETKRYIENLKKNLNFVSNEILKDIIIQEINILDDKKNIIEIKLSKLLNCDEVSLEKSIKEQKLIKAINNSNLPEKIDTELIENNFLDYINLGQKKRKRALLIFIERNNKKYTTVKEISDDLDIIVNELKKQSYGLETISI